MFERLTHKFQSLVNRHGLWLNLCLLLLVSYGVLSWMLSSNWWKETYRTPSKAGQKFRAKLNGFDFKPAIRPDEIGDLRLIGTLLSEGNEPTAIVNHRGRRRVLHPGEAVENGLEVVSIESGMLTVKMGVIFHTLALPVPATAPKVGAGVQIDLDRTGAVESFPALQWTPVPLGGTFIAMRLQAPAPARIADTFGFREGDLIESVNGLPVTADGVREKLLERIRNDESIVLMVRRDGRALRLRYALYD